MSLFTTLRGNLNVKLILAIWLVLGLVIALFLFIQIHFGQKAFLHETIDNAHRFSNTVKNSTRNDMLNDRRENVQRIIEAVSREEGVERVRIFNRQGVIMLSTRSEEVGRVVDKQAEACFGCHTREQPLSRLSSSSRTRIFKGPDSAKILGIINPIYNEPSCSSASCHAHPLGVEVLGVLDIDMSLARMGDRIKGQLPWIILLSILLYLSISATIYLLVLFLVIKPVNRLTEGALQMARGDFDVYIPDQARDQIGELAQAFNKLGNNLKVRTRDLLEKRKDYRTLIQSVTNYVMSINPDYQITMCNDLVRRDFLVDPEGTCYQAWKGRTEPCPDCPVKSCFEKGEVVTNQDLVILKDGSSATFEVKATPVKNDFGEVISVILAATDIDQTRRLAQKLGSSTEPLDERVAERIQELQSSEKRYRTIFERSLDMILLLNQELKIIDINLAGLQLLDGFSREEILEFGSLKDFFSEKAAFEPFKTKLLRKGIIRDYETTLLAKPGHLLPVLISANAISDENGQIISYEAFVRDIYLLRLKEEALRQQNIELASINEISRLLNQSLFLEELFNQVADKLMEVLKGNSLRIYRLDEKKETLNLVVARGLTDDFIGKSYIQRRKVGEGILGQAAQSDRAVIIDNFQEVESVFKEEIAREILQSAVYIPLVSKGSVVGVLCSTSRLQNKFSRQDVKFLTAIGRPIGMAIENAHLYQETCRAYQELKAAHEHIYHREKLASLGRLAATVAHEINNPITSVLTYITLLRKLFAKGPLPESRLMDIRRYLATMESETARCGDIVKNLLDFSRQTKPKIEWVDLRELVGLSLTLIGHELKLKSIVLEKKIPAYLPLVLCDAKQIHQVILNLLGNAIEAMPEGGKLTLALSFDENENTVILLIEDSGIGIPPEDLGHIFEPFFTTKEEGKGVGLGLSVVHGIVTKHGGTIEVASQVGRGTRFWVRLPKSKPRADQKGRER